MADGKIPAGTAWREADRILAHLRDVCERVEVAGSLRRWRSAINAGVQPRKDTVGDIEIVAVPRLGDPPRNLLGEIIGDAPNLLHQRLDAGAFPRHPKKCWGNLQRRVLWTAQDGYDTPVQLEIWMASPEWFGLHYTIRTGSARHNIKLFTPRSRGGLLPPGHYVQGGKLWLRLGHAGSEPIELPDEAAWEPVLGHPLPPPHEREDWTHD